MSGEARGSSPSTSTATDEVLITEATTTTIATSVSAAAAAGKGQFGVSQLLGAIDHRKRQLETEDELAEEKRRKHGLDQLIGDEDLDSEEEDDDFGTEDEAEAQREYDRNGLSAGGAGADGDASIDSDGLDLSSGYNSDSSIEGPERHVMRYIMTQQAKGVNPLNLLAHFGYVPAEDQEEYEPALLWRVATELLLEMKRLKSARRKLPEYNTMDDAVRLLRNARKIIVLTGAGVSVSCGIPDFRSKGGLYDQIAAEFELPDPQALFDIHYFRDDPQPFFKFAKELLPGNYKPSPSHAFIKLLEANGQLLRNYTQNIDTLENVAGIQNVIQCHGSFANATCLGCGRKFTCDDIREDMKATKVPMCPSCDSVIKPDITFFGEKLPDLFDRSLKQDRLECDLVIVMGSSLKVQPVASVISFIPNNVPQILINREVVGKPSAFDIELLGNCDAVVGELCRRLGWTLPTDLVPQQVPVLEEGEVEFVPPSRYLFPGARPPTTNPLAGADHSDSDSDDDSEVLRADAEAGTVTVRVDVSSSEEDDSEGADDQAADREEQPDTTAASD